jgi:cytochrome P450
MISAAKDPLLGMHPANRETIYRTLRETMPVYRSAVHAGWVLTRYADVSTVLRHPDALALDAMPFLQSLSDRGALRLSKLLAFVSSLSLLNRPPRHEAIRRVLAQALAGVRNLSLAQMLEHRATELLERGAHDGRIDLAAGYGRALALFVIGRFLGIAEADVCELGVVAADFMAIFERQLPSVSMLKKLNDGAGALMTYFADLIRARRQSPADDGISLIVRLSDESLACSDEELAGHCTFFFIAAEETTGAAITSAARSLLQLPELQSALRTDPSRIADAARELLRLASPVQYVARQLRSDIHIADQRIPAGDALILMLGSANRDPAAFPDPDEVDLDRRGPDSLVFAAGPYRCVGAQLATFEMEVAIRNLLAWRGLSLSRQPPTWTDRMNIAPIRHLEAVYEPRGSS